MLISKEQFITTLLPWAVIVVFIFVLLAWLFPWQTLIAASTTLGVWLSWYLMSRMRSRRTPEQIAREVRERSLSDAHDILRDLEL